MNIDCEHEWVTMYEESILHIIHKTGYKCKLCGRYVTGGGYSPAELGGRVTERSELYPFGGIGNIRDGRQYTRQVHNALTGEVRVFNGKKEYPR